MAKAQFWIWTLVVISAIITIWALLTTPGAF